MTHIPARKSRRSPRSRAAPARDLRLARRIIASDPKIFCGDPVFRGTRIPVHLIAELVAQGCKPDELLEGYPRLTANMVRLASLYAAKYPLRRHRRRKPWHEHQAVRRTRRKLSSRVLP